MRGNPGRPETGIPASRSIPAHAGEPSDVTLTDISAAVYPRTCGGTCDIHALPAAHFGLSPHMRGNRCGMDRSIPRAGSIPAHAGEPHSKLERPYRHRVYPRTCGGTYGQRVDSLLRPGLSPHMRGNRMAAILGPLLFRSIPAHAGEPTLESVRRPDPGVYPRTCGGTDRGSIPSFHPQGLSPHMRGNL